MRIRCTINGEQREVDGVWEGESLLHVLRERLDLAGSKNACEQGECGSCSIYMDDTLVCSCLVLAGQADGATLETIEGLADRESEELHPIQEAFLEAGAVGRNAKPSELEVREALAGNLCRCTGYEKILEAVQVAAERSAQ
jgi:aerobic carbon-monoxide dehydrogenase small subunit